VPLLREKNEECIREKRTSANRGTPSVILEIAVCVVWASLRGSDRANDLVRRLRILLSAIHGEMHVVCRKRYLLTRR